MGTEKPVGAREVAGARTGRLEVDVPAYLHAHGCHETAAHTAGVVDRARAIAARAGPDPALDPGQLVAAAWLHDVGAAVPAERRAATARVRGLEVFPEEEAWPALLHQKVSVVIAQDVFGVRDDAVLAAIGCHSTLRPGSTTLDQALFVADKLSWDEAEARP